MQKLLPRLLWCNVLLILITFLTYLSPVIDPRQFWLPAMIGLFYPWLLALNLICILFWISLRKWYFILSLACLLIGWGHLNNIIGLKLSTTEPLKTSSGLTIMTFNSYAFKQKRKKMEPKERIERGKLIYLLRTAKPDVICFQEFAVSKYKERTFKQWVQADNEYPYSFVDYDTKLAIYSRFPLENQRAENFENSYNGYQRVDLTIDGQKIRVFNLHLQTNAISKLTDKVVGEGTISSKETWRNLGGMLERYQRAAGMRVEQAVRILDEVEKSPLPVIICGDFNDVPQSYVYRLFKQNRVDAFQEAGRGLGVTYSGKIPGLRIDYIFAPKGSEVLKTDISNPGFSDHRPVISKIRLNAL